jgi:hypothetical protein
MTATAADLTLVSSTEALSMILPSCVGELEPLVSGADHCPLGFDFVKEPAQQELAEASRMFDLTEHESDERLFAGEPGPLGRAGPVLSRPMR